MAEESGAKASLIIQNGETLILSEKGQRRGGPVSSGRRLVHGKCVDDYPSVVVGERGKLSRTGLVVVLLFLKEETGGLLSRPIVEAIGVLPTALNEEVVRASQRALISLVGEATRADGIDLEKLEKEASIAVRREFKSRLGFKPVMKTIISQASSKAIGET
jgi:mRNA degradation ribonuclease J1/J2